MARWWIRVGAGLLVLLAGGCGGYVAFEVDSEPQGARVYVGSELVGQTPTGVLYRRTSDPGVPVTIETMGYKPLTVLVASQVTYETKEEAERHLRSFRFVLKPRY